MAYQLRKPHASPGGKSVKKLIIALLLITVLVFSGCANEREYIKEKIPVFLTHYDMPHIQSKWVTLYYPNSDFSDVLAFSQPINATGAVYEEIMEALLTGTKEGYVSPFPQGVSCRSIMLVQDILYIDMSWQFGQLSKETFFACVSVLVSTFANFLEVSFINITVEGKQITLPGLPQHPIMLLSRYTGTIQALNSHYLRHSEDSAVLETFYGTIYIADETGKYIIPKSSSMTVRENNYASVLVSALLAESTTIFPNGFMLSGEVGYDGKTETVSINLICPQQWNYTEGWLGPHALISTLNSLYWQATTLKLKVTDSQGAQKAQINEKTADYFNKIKSVVQVITPDASGTGLMRTNMLASTMPGSGDLKGFINEYLCTINPQFRNNQSVVNGVVINNDMVIVDLSTEYFKHYEKTITSSESEYAVIYSLISVACTYTGTSKALLLQDGQIRSTLSGYLKTDQPLLNLPSEYIQAIP